MTKHQPQFFQKLKNRRIFFLFLLFSVVATAQDSLKVKEQALHFLNEAEDALAQNNFPEAEAAYRKSIAKDPSNVAAKYNFGNTYYTKELYNQAAERYVQAAEVATSKEEKHRIFHNLGNVYMNQKKYSEAVKAYKKSLLNKPSDDETRYNLAYAKMMLEEENKKKKQDQEKGDEQNKDQKGDQDEQKKEGNQDPKQGDQKGDQKDNKEKGEEEKKENGEPKDGKPKEKENGDKGENGEKEQPKGEQPQPSKGQLSPERVESLLEAIENQEKKIQDKINAKKAQGIPQRAEKDW